MDEERSLSSYQPWCLDEPSMAEIYASMHQLLVGESGGGSSPSFLAFVASWKHRWLFCEKDASLAQFTRSFYLPRQLAMVAPYRKAVCFIISDSQDSGVSDGTQQLSVCFMCQESVSAAKCIFHATSCDGIVKRAVWLTHTLHSKQTATKTFFILKRLRRWSLTCEETFPQLYNPFPRTRVEEKKEKPQLQITIYLVESTIQLTRQLVT